MNDRLYQLTVSPLQFTRGGVAFIMHDAPPDDYAARVDFHVSSGDYFSTLATIMELLADLSETGDAETRRRCIATMRELRRDLLHAHNRYRIEPKTK